jgi:hypothetical protein
VDKNNVYVYMHTHNGVYSAIKKNGIMLFVGKWMELEILILSEISQIQKDKSCTSSHMWNIYIHTQHECKHGAVIWGRMLGRTILKCIASM